MNMKKTLLFVLAGLMFQTALAADNASFQSGTYEYEHKNAYGKITLQMQKNKMAKFQLYSQYLTYQEGEREPSMSYTGQVDSISRVVGNTIKYHTKKYEGCDITLTKKNNGILVKQDGGCGMGNHVNASGFYKFKSKKIDFEPTTY